MGSKRCGFNGCDRVHHARGYCKAHYLQFRRGQELRPARDRDTATLSEKFHRGTMPVTESSCVLWAARVNAYGYGVISHDNTDHMAHRVGYTLQIGGIPDGMSLDHRCGVRSCVNVEHLRPATQADNTAHRTQRHGRGSSSGHRNVYWNPSREYYEVKLGHGGKSLWFGSFTDIEDAARVASEKRREIYGEFAGIDK